MLRLTTDQPDFWDYLLPEEARRMHPELRVVDAVLDDQRFLEPFRGRFSARRGRYTIPMETYLRMMYLKTKYQLGYESLVEEVTDSVSWRRFWHQPQRASAGCQHLDQADQRSVSGTGG